MAESDASSSKVFGVLATSNTGNGNGSSRKVDTTFVFIIFEHVKVVGALSVIENGLRNNL